MPLLGCPNEVLELVLTLTSPADLENLAISCQHLQSLASRELELHRQRKRRYSKVCFYGCYRHGGYEEENLNAEVDEVSPILVHPFQLLRDICNDFRIAFYPTTMLIRCCNATDKELPHGLGPGSIRDEIDAYGDQVCQRLLVSGY